MLKYAGMDSYKKIFILVFSVALGIVALAVLFKGSQQSADLRSRADEDRTISKQWEFNGDTTEGWVGQGAQALVANGLLQFTIPASTTNPLFIQNQTVSTTVPRGAKQLKFSISVGKPRRGGSDDTREIGIGAIRPTPGSPSAALTPSSGFSAISASSGGLPITGRSLPLTPRPTNITPTPAQRVTLRVYYQLSTKSDYESPKEVIITPNRPLYSVLVPLPVYPTVTIKSIKVEFYQGFVSGQVVSIDWIRLLGPLVQPTGSCNFGVQNVSVTSGSCQEGYAIQMNYTCYDGYTGTVGDGTTCQLINPMTDAVSNKCQGRSICPTLTVTAAATSTVAPTSQPIASPTFVPNPRFTPMPTRSFLHPR